MVRAVPSVRVRDAASAHFLLCWLLAAAELFASPVAPAGRDMLRKAPLSWSRGTAAAPTLPSRVLRLRGGAQGLPTLTEDGDRAWEVWEMPTAADERGSCRVLCLARSLAGSGCAPQGRAPSDALNCRNFKG